jgi:hypothetical protein
MVGGVEAKPPHALHELSAAHHSTGHPSATKRRRLSTCTTAITARTALTTTVASGWVLRPRPLAVTDMTSAEMDAVSVLLNQLVGCGCRAADASGSSHGKVSSGGQEAEASYTLPAVVVGGGAVNELDSAEEGGQDDANGDGDVIDDADGTSTVQFKRIEVRGGGGSTTPAFGHEQLPRDGSLLTVNSRDAVRTVLCSALPCPVRLGTAPSSSRMLYPPPHRHARTSCSSPGPPSLQMPK